MALWADELSLRTWMLPEYNYYYWHLTIELRYLAPAELKPDRWKTSTIRYLAWTFTRPLDKVENRKLLARISMGIYCLTFLGIWQGCKILSVLLLRERVPTHDRLWWKMGVCWREQRNSDCNVRLDKKSGVRVVCSMYTQRDRWRGREAHIL